MRVGFDLSKTYFFDRKVVQDLSKTTQRVLSKFGAYVRTRARSLINRKPTKKQRTSRPGEPPRKQVGTLRQFLFFAYDPFDKSVVIGPAKTNQVFFGNDGKPVRGTVPQILEHGGQIRVLEAKYGERWIRGDLRSKRRLAEMQTRLRTVTIAARPYMKPAFDKELPKLREWRKSA